MNIGTGWRTIMAAAVKLVLKVAEGQDWIPGVDENQFVLMVNQVVDAAIWIFLALKGNRVLEALGKR